jgi:cell division protein FtsQ
VLRRRALALALGAAAVFAGYHFWLRDSSLFAVEDVEVSGVTANKAEVTAALERAAYGMTTLHLRDDELREAVQRFPTVASISADAKLLHGLEVTVTERLPVAEARLGGELLPVSADGFALVGLEVDEPLPRIEARAKGAILDDEGAAQAAIVGAAPSDLRDGVRSASWETEAGGVVVELSGAPEVRFGDGERAEEKWEALAAVLAEGVPAGSYIDVSVPERPVASQA